MWLKIIVKTLTSAQNPDKSKRSFDWLCYEMVENELKCFVVECKLRILYFFHNKTTSSNMESLQVLRQIQTIPEEAISKLSRRLELLRCKLSNSVINVFKVLHLSELGYCNQCVLLDTLVSTCIFISWLIRPNPDNVWKYINSEFILVLVNSVLTRYVTMIWLI